MPVGQTSVVISEGWAVEGNIGMHLEFLDLSTLIPTSPFPLHALDGYKFHIWPLANDGVHRRCGLLEGDIPCKSQTRSQTVPKKSSQRLMGVKKRTEAVRRVEGRS